MAPKYKNYTIQQAKGCANSVVNLGGGFMLKRTAKGWTAHGWEEI